MSYKEEVVQDVFEELKTELEYTFPYEEWGKVAVGITFNNTDEKARSCEPGFLITDVDNAIRCYLHGLDGVAFYPLEEAKKVIRREVERRVDMGFTRRGV